MELEVIVVQVHPVPRPWYVHDSEHMAHGPGLRDLFKTMILIMVWYLGHS